MQHISNGCVSVSVGEVHSYILCQLGLQFSLIPPLIDTVIRTFSHNFAELISHSSLGEYLTQVLFIEPSNGYILGLWSGYLFGGVLGIEHIIPLIRPRLTLSLLYAHARSIFRYLLH